MPRTVQIRNLDDATYAALTRRAAEAGLSVPELLRQEVERLVARPSLTAWLAGTSRRPSAVTAAETLESLDEHRGAWPDAGR